MEEPQREDQAVGWLIHLHGSDSRGNVESRYRAMTPHADFSASTDKQRPALIRLVDRSVVGWGRRRLLSALSGGSIPEKPRFAHAIGSALLRRDDIAHNACQPGRETAELTIRDPAFHSGFKPHQKPRRRRAKRCGKLKVALAIQPDGRVRRSDRTERSRADIGRSQIWAVSLAIE